MQPGKIEAEVIAEFRLSGKDKGMHREKVVFVVEDYEGYLFGFLFGCGQS